MAQIGFGKHVRREVSVVVLALALGMTITFWKMAYQQEKLDAFAQSVVGVYTLEEI